MIIRLEGKTVNEECFVTVLQSIDLKKKIPRRKNIPLGKGQEEGLSSEKRPVISRTRPVPS